MNTSLIHWRKLISVYFIPMIANLDSWLWFNPSRVIIKTKMYLSIKQGLSWLDKEVAVWVQFFLQDLSVKQDSKNIQSVFLKDRESCRMLGKKKNTQNLGVTHLNPKPYIFVSSCGTPTICVKFCTGRHIHFTAMLQPWLYCEKSLCLSFPGSTSYNLTWLFMAILSSCVYQFNPCGHYYRGLGLGWIYFWENDCSSLIICCSILWRNTTRIHYWVFGIFCQPGLWSTPELRLDHDTMIHGFDLCCNSDSKLDNWNKHALRCLSVQFRACWLAAASRLGCTIFTPGWWQGRWALMLVTAIW